jgi:hypothetical protein
MPGRAATSGGAARARAGKSTNKATNTTNPAPQSRALVSRHGPDAIAELARLSTTATPDSARLSAIGMLLDRAYGKPRQTLEHTGEDGGPIQVTIAGDDAALL